MCNFVLFEHFRSIALIATLGITTGAVFRFVPPLSWRRALAAVASGAGIFLLGIGGAVVSVNHCASLWLNEFDQDGDGVFVQSEQGGEFYLAQALVVGDGGRNVLALASPVIGAAFALVLVPVASIRSVLRGGRG